MYTFIPYRRNLLENARKNRKNPTEAEKKFWYEVLQKEEFNAYKFLRQKLLDNFIVDFYCSKLKLVVEIDGDTHDKVYDDKRTQKLETYGLQVIRYTNRDIISNIEGVYEDLIKKLIK